MANFLLTAGGDEDVVGTLTKLRVSEDVDEREKCLDRIINYLNENENGKC